jgi:tetratricopeptide (TPR) repeat protein
VRTVERTVQAAAQARGRDGSSHPAFARMTTVTAALVAALTAGVLGGCGDSETAMARGDRLWADSSYVEALAEYRLSYQRRKDSDELLARVAHAYAVTGELPRARQYYTELLDRAPGYKDQAVFDFLTLARKAHARGDRYGVAGAVQEAVKLRPGLPVGDLATGLARYYASTGDSPKALEYFERALGSAAPDSVPALLFEIATLHETSGNCSDAITMFNAYRARTSNAEKADEARWHVGSCSWELAKRAGQAGDTVGALRYIQTVIDLGAPQNVLDQVWFERGELLLGQGRRDEALEAFVRSLENNRTGSGQLAERARRRIDELRFGR